MRKDTNQDDSVLRETPLRARSRRAQSSKTEDIDWSRWWPFERATGEALRQLNRRQPKPVEQFEEAPF